MHKWLWVLHEDHHRKRPGFFEKNDAFFNFPLFPSMLLLLVGTTKPIHWMVCVGAGIALYEQLILLFTI
jgi:beta-carotene 3-hydroxylase